MRGFGRGKTLTRLAALGTLSRSAVRERGYNAFNSKLLSRTVGEGGPSSKGSVGEGSAAFELTPQPVVYSCGAAPHPNPLPASGAREK